MPPVHVPSLTLPAPFLTLRLCAAGHCYYRIEEYWTFELCFQKQLRQYHKDGGSVEVREGGWLAWGGSECEPAAR